jgi:SAM-dependent methyltransferase
LEFADPLQRDKSEEEFFGAAYRGELGETDLTDFHDRLGQRQVIIEELHNPSLWFWTPAFGMVLDWAKQRFDPGSTIFEIGCGLGFFLHALRDEGFDAVGLDVADVAVSANRRDGFRVWQGTIETLPKDWVSPEAVACFFVMHHLADPMSFFRTLRERAPDAPLAVAVYGPSNKGGAASLPPRTLIRWNGKALQTALEMSGYQVVVHDLPSTGVERFPVNVLRRLLAPTRRVPALYRAGKSVEGFTVSRMPKGGHREAYVVLAFAEPARTA